MSNDIRLKLNLETPVPNDIRIRFPRKDLEKVIEKAKSGARGLAGLVASVGILFGASEVIPDNPNPFYDSPEPAEVREVVDKPVQYFISIPYIEDRGNWINLLNYLHENDIPKEFLLDSQKLPGGSHTIEEQVDLVRVGPFSNLEEAMDVRDRLYEEQKVVEGDIVESGGQGEIIVDSRKRSYEGRGSREERGFELSESESVATRVMQNMPLDGDYQKFLTRIDNAENTLVDLMRRFDDEWRSADYWVEVWDNQVELARIKNTETVYDLFEKYGVDYEDLVASFARTESDFNPNAISSSDAKGERQQKKISFDSLGEFHVPWSYDEIMPDKNHPDKEVDVVKQHLSADFYLIKLIRRFMDLDAAVSAYYDGPSSTERRGGPSRRGQNYRNKVMGPLDM